MQVGKIHLIPVMVCELTVLMHSGREECPHAVQCYSRTLRTLHAGL